MAEPALDPLPPPAGLRVANTFARGRGVFASRAFAAGERLELAPVLLVPRGDCERLRGTLLDDYFFWWDEAHNACALGFGSLYNHDCPANARFRLDPARRAIEFTAVRAIAAGEEVTVNYHGEPDDPRPVWFATAPKAP